jgi:hypothetical protein
VPVEVYLIKFRHFKQKGKNYRTLMVLAPIDLPINQLTYQSPAEKSVMEQLYEAVRDINIGNRTYKIQSVGGEFNMFVIKKPDQEVCKIFLNEENEWQTNCHLPSADFGEILHLIKGGYE